MFRMLKNVFDNEGSDLFISVDFPPSMKHQGLMKSLSTQELSAEKTKLFAYSLMNEKQQLEFEENLECNFAINIPESSQASAGQVHLAYRVCSPYSFRQPCA